MEKKTTTKKLITKQEKCLLFTGTQRDTAEISQREGKNIQFINLFRGDPLWSLWRRDAAKLLNRCGFIKRCKQSSVKSGPYAGQLHSCFSPSLAGTWGTRHAPLIKTGLLQQLSLAAFSATIPCKLQLQSLVPAPFRHTHISLKTSSQSSDVVLVKLLIYHTDSK